MHISQISKILDTAQKYIQGEVVLWQLADVLEMPLSKLESLLTWNNAIDGANRPFPWIGYQDIVNIILLYYAMRPYHEFILTVFGDSSEGSVSMAAKEAKQEWHMQTRKRP